MKKTTRLRLRFSLLTALLVLSGLSVWLGLESNEARNQREILTKIHEVGGGTLPDWWLAGRKAPPGPAWLRSLIGEEYFEQVRGVMLDQAGRLSDNEVTTLCINLRGQNITNINLSNIGRWTDHITDAALAEMRQIPALETLTLSYTEISDVGLLHLEGHPRLQQLQLAHTKVSDRGLPSLELIPELNWVNLSGTNVTSAAIARLRSKHPDWTIFE